MIERISITPFTRPVDATLALPGSKSITNRALLLAALADGSTRLEGALFSRDTRIMLQALVALGFETAADESAKTITVSGLAGRIPRAEATLHVGNAGTAARFLTALLALHPDGTYHLDGDPPMRERPMAGLLDALRSLQAADFEFHDEPGHFPFTLKAKGYRAAEATIDARASSQILSALLLAAPAGADSDLICTDVRPQYVDITLKMREAFGAAQAPADSTGRYRLPKTRYMPPIDGTYAIEPDISAASYFLALTLIHTGTLQIPHLNANPMQGDAHFVEVLSHHGLRVDAGPDQWTVACPSHNDPQRGHREIDFSHISDTFLTYAAIAPLLGESVRITGIGHTRHQETDRIAGMAAELSKLGQLVKEESDALTIQPKPNELRARALKARNTGQLLSIDTYEDHRFAMSFAILASFDLLGDGKPWLSIQDPACCGKTFPNFFETLEMLHHA